MEVTTSMYLNTITVASTAFFEGVRSLILREPELKKDSFLGFLWVRARQLVSKYQTVFFQLFFNTPPYLSITSVPSTPLTFSESSKLISKHELISESSTKSSTETSTQYSTKSSTKYSTK
jgi:hypothetical protein